jgi:hypothetical protein
MEIDIVYFSKIYRENSSFIKIWQEWRVLCTYTYVHSWQYLAAFFSEWEMFQTKVVEKIKTHFMFNNFFSRKSCRVSDIVEKYGTARQATDDNIIRHMHIPCSITKAADTHSEYVILIVFSRQQWLRERASMSHFTYIACLV